MPGIAVVPERAARCARWALLGLGALPAPPPARGRGKQARMAAVNQDVSSAAPGGSGPCSAGSARTVVRFTRLQGPSR